MDGRTIREDEEILEGKKKKIQLKEVYRAPNGRNKEIRKKETKKILLIIVKLSK